MTPNLGFSSSTLRADAIAGLTAAAVVLPKAMAYATVAGLSVSVGLYTAFVPLIVYALIGTSRVLSVSSTTTLAILTGAQLGLAVPDGDPVKLTVAAATLTALTGVLLIAASVLRLGFLATSYRRPCSPASRLASGWSSCSTKCRSCSAFTSPNGASSMTSPAWRSTCQRRR